MESVKLTHAQLLTRTGLLLAVALIIQMMRLPQYITGPAVNCVLVMAVMTAGLAGSITIGCVTPIAALYMGILSPILTPLILFIAAANAIYSSVFYLASKGNAYVGVLIAAAAKFGAFYIVIRYFLAYLQINLPAPAIAAFQIPQLYTALAGGFIALLIGSRLKAYVIN
jgi:hypothetical protein